MADVQEKPVETENKQAGGDAGARDTGGGRDDREFKSVEDAKRDQERERDPQRQTAELTKKVQDGATAAGWKEVGNGQDIYGNPAVKASLDSNKSSDPSARLKDGKLSFAGFDANQLNADDITGKNGGERMAMAGSVGLVGRGMDKGAGKGQDNTQDRVQEAPAGSDRGSRPGDNNVRDIDPAKDNPEAVTQRYNQMVDGLGLSPQESARMKEQFGKDMAKMKEGFKGGDMSHVMRSMNLDMDQNNHLQNDSNRVNAVAGLAARGADATEANRQGANPTCALTSESRIEQQRNFVKYADQMGSVAARGGAWRGGENGTQPTWVDVDAAGTNHANFRADGEASRMYNPAYHQAGGHRDYLGQLDNAVVGGEMAKYAGQRDGKDYVYVAANSQRAGADVGQGSNGGALMERGRDGTLRQSYDGNQAVSSPPSTLDMVAKVNHANGGGGLMIQENLAAQFRQPDGSYPPGMNTFKDAADLRRQLSAHPNQEYQIATNGVIVAGMQGHGLHAQTVKLNDKGQLEFGNNWTDQHNKKVYGDDFVNTFTNPKNWDGFRPQHTVPDGHGNDVPDWRRETVGPKTQDVVKPGESNDKKKDEEDENKKKAEQKKKADEEEQNHKDKDKQKQQQDKAVVDFQKQHDDWKARRDDWAAKHKDSKEEFGEKEPQLSQFF